MGLGAGCGVGIGFGYGLGRGKAFDQHGTHSNLGPAAEPPHSRRPLPSRSGRSWSGGRTDVRAAFHELLDDFYHAFDTNLGRGKRR
eukprot:SM000033S12384  [mRNA]  locus=s33:503230:503871:- [translate_table: standard]